MITDNLNVTALVPNVFIKTGSGSDALDMNGLGGRNVLDGSTGSNFLTGGSTGNTTFFLDDRNAGQDIWTTVRGLHTGEDATVWGLTPSNFNIATGDDVLPTAPGLDFSITAPGKAIANLTLTGYHTSDLGGVLGSNFGSTPDSDYMLVHVT